MKNKIEKYIPQAIEAVKAELYRNGKVKSEFNGYISSLGSGLVQSGLLPTLAFYASLTSGSMAHRYLLLNAIFKTLGKANMTDDLVGNELLLVAIEKDEKPLESFQLKEDIKNAAVAIKLAIRTFPLEKRTEN